MLHKRPLPIQTELTKTIVSNVTKYVGDGKELFAVVSIGDNQYKVMRDDVIRTIPIKATIGTKMHLNKILMVGSPNFTIIGRPMLNNNVYRNYNPSHGYDDVYQYINNKSDVSTSNVRDQVPIHHSNEGNPYKSMFVTVTAIVEEQKRAQNVPHFRDYLRKHYTFWIDNKMQCTHLRILAINIHNFNLVNPLDKYTGALISNDNHTASTTYVKNVNVHPNLF